MHKLQVMALVGQRVIQVACGSRDAQTLALTDEGLVYSWGDGDFGKLGRGGSEGCNVPHPVERLTGQGVIQIECGAQFSLALTKQGQVWTWSVFVINSSLGSCSLNLCNCCIINKRTGWQSLKSSNKKDISKADRCPSSVDRIEIKTISYLSV